MAAVSTMQIEVAYARADVQVLIPLEVPEGTTVEQALILSRVQERFAEIDLATYKVGIFGRFKTLSARLSPGDRIEIYRPLIADPKVIRKRRAAEGKRGCQRS